MKLPYAEHVRVDREKVTDYLLSPSHPDGASKANSFTRHGFRVENWQILAEALRKHGQTHPVVKVVDSNYGSRYSIDGDSKHLTGAVRLYGPFGFWPRARRSPDW